MFLPRGLIFGTFGAFLVGLRSLILDADFHAFLQRFLRPSGFAISNQLPTDLKQQISIPAFPIGQQGQIFTVLDDLFQRLNGLLKQLSVFFATFQRPK